MNVKRSLLSLLICTAFILPVSAEEPAKESSKKGTVIFYRSRSAKGGAVRLNITGANNETIGLLTNGSKIVKEQPVGEITYVATSPSIAGRNSVTVKVEAGKTYYVKGEALLGFPAARSKITLMDEAKGKAESDKIK